MHPWKFETQQLHVGQETADSATGARCVPIYQTSSYVFADAIQNLAVAGDHLVSSSAVYGGTYNLFAHTFADCGIGTTFVSQPDAAAYEAAIRPNTKAIFVESLGNPNCNLVDVEAIAQVAHRHGIPLIVDNTFATAYFFRPLEHDADVVVHSATKFIGRHGNSIGGLMVDGGRFDWAQNEKFPGLSQPNPSFHGVVFTQAAGSAAYITKARVTLLRDTGACMAPLNAFLFLQGVETLSLRMDRHWENTQQVLSFLERHPQVAALHHPAVHWHRTH